MCQRHMAGRGYLFWEEVIDAFESCLHGVLFDCSIGRVDMDASYNFFCPLLIVQFCVFEFRILVRAFNFQSPRESRRN